MRPQAPSPRGDVQDGTLDPVDAAIDRLSFGAGRGDGRTNDRPAPSFHVLLACLDASRESELALQWARHLAAVHGARVVVASVFPPPQVDAAVAGPYGFYPGLASAYQEWEERLEEVSRSAAGLLREDGIDAESVFTLGRPVHELAEVARTHHADLVVLGSRGHHGLGRALGSTADALLDRVEASVLVARTPTPPTRILAATDGSAASRLAVAWALDHARATGVPVTLDHVVEYPEGARHPSEGLLRDAVEGMRLAPLPRVTYHLDAGRPAERILATARSAGADLVVLGSRGLGRVRGWILGSVSRRVASAAPVSVLVVKQAPERA